MASSDDFPKPQRRIRYRGKNPVQFDQKYKEHNPDLYSDDIEHVRQRGATPVGTHRPICIDEILKILNPMAGETALDATLGYGGHSSHIFPRLMPGGRLIALDQDPIERPKTESRLRKSGFSQESFIVGAINFGQARLFLNEIGTPKVDLILADLGLSSMQIDHPGRGFSYKTNAPLDLRMNPEIGFSAAELLTTISVGELTEILHTNSDELRAEIIAKFLILKKPKTSAELVEVMRAVMSGFSKKVQDNEGDAPIRRVFQALRIAVNDEFGVLDQFLKDVPLMLKSGGRIAILSFHSGEDRRVKKSFQNGQRQGLFSQISTEFIRPGPEEQRSNSRSKSAKLRWAILK